MSEWLVIYLFGCAVAVFLWIAELAVFSVLDWILKMGILRKNLKKLEEPDTDGFWPKFWGTAVLLVFSFALSWVQVLIGIGMLLRRAGLYLQDFFASVPEDIKQLRFPLRNNPEMSREAVWAYVEALHAKTASKLHTERVLLHSLQAVMDSHKQFDPGAALAFLKSLNAVTPEAIAAAMQTVEEGRNKPGLPLAITKW